MRLPHNSIWQATKGQKQGQQREKTGGIWIWQVRSRGSERDGRSEAEVGRSRGRHKLRETETKQRETKQRESRD